MMPISTRSVKQMDPLRVPMERLISEYVTATGKRPTPDRIMRYWKKRAAYLRRPILVLDGDDPKFLYTPPNMIDPSAYDALVKELMDSPGFHSFCDKHGPHCDRLATAREVVNINLEKGVGTAWRYDAMGEPLSPVYTTDDKLKIPEGATVFTEMETDECS